MARRCPIVMFLLQELFLTNFVKNIDVTRCFYFHILIKESSRVVVMWLVYLGSRGLYVEPSCSMPALPCNPSYWRRYKPYLLNNNGVIITVSHRGRDQSLSLYIELAEQSRDVVGGLIEDKVELGIGLVHLVSFQQAETGSSQQMVLVDTRVSYFKCKNAGAMADYQLLWQTLAYLIIHDDLVCHSIEQRGLRDELFLGIFVFLFTCLLDIVSCQRVQTGHLIFLVVSVVEVSIDTSRL